MNNHYATYPHGVPLLNEDKRAVVNTMLAGEEWRQWGNRGEATNQDVLVRPTETHEAALAPQYTELHLFLTRVGTKMARSAASAYGPKRDCENELSSIRAPRTRL